MHQTIRRAANRVGWQPAIATIPVPNGRIRMRIGGDLIARTAWARGWDSFETPLPLVYARSIQPSAVVLDVGANTGFYSLLAATIHPSVHVDAFEPLPNVVDELRSNISLNRQGEQITVNEAAVDDAEGVAELYVPLPTEGVIETSASLQRSFRSEWSETITVDRTTIDAHCEARDRVDVLKIDAECRELQVLAGASATLRRHRPIVFLEIMDCDDWQSPVEAIDEIREELGYVSVALRPGGCRARDRVAYDEPWRNQALWPREKLTALGI